MIKKIKQSLIASVLIMALVSCKETETSDIEIKGRIKNVSAGMIYLEELPISTMQPKIVDSAGIENDGKYELKANPSEETILQIRLHRNMMPVAVIISDKSKITLNAEFENEDNQFPKSYEVKGSPASQQLKEYTEDFGNKLREIYLIDQKGDSLQKAGASESELASLFEERSKTASKVKDLTVQFVNRSNSPALSMYILGYHQSTANQNPQLQIEGIGNEEITKMLGEIVNRFPEHQAVAAVKKAMDEQMARFMGWVGQAAPEISLPDTEGKEVKLSSFRGKYVLVDFWASWCKPCRYENPHVVKAFNKYRDKNFTVLGVSLDQEKNAWLKAIKDDKLTWTHISDLKFWGSEVVPMYRIESIPFNVLVDPDGKIIAQNLRGETIEEKLEEVLK